MSKFIIIAVLVPLIICAALSYWEGVAFVFIAWLSFALGAGWEFIKRTISQIKNN